MAPVNILSPVTSKMFMGQHINLFNGVVRRVKKNSNRGIMHHALEIIVLTDGTGRSNLLHYCS